MRVLADYHHSDLFESFALTFVDRFGWDLYRPIGMGWYDEGIWNFERAYHGDAVARQYLQLWDSDVLVGDHWERADTTHPGRTYRMVTLEQARSQGWDIVISSLPDNDRGLHGLAQDRHAAFGIQLGNVGQMSAWELADFALCSTAMPYTPAKPYVVYRQEFSLQDFRYEPPPREDFRVASFVQCLPENPLAYAQFLRYARSEPSFDWRIYGSYGSHETDEYAAGNLPTTPAVAAGMRGVDVGWHSKEWSDGYGHVIHNLFAVGRPVFGIARYYEDKLAGPLWVDGVTSIDISRREPSEVLDILRRLRENPDEHLRMCEASAARFREVVSFDEDAEKVRGLIESVAGVPA